MSEKETITVADVSAGEGDADDVEAGTPVEVPVVELLTGRGFITGKSGSGKSNTASVVIEKLLSKNFPVLIVDTDGEYYGLKEEFELLHAGADEECDIHVTPDHAEKLASLALEQNVPIILDVSSYLDESDANEMVLEVTKHLFAKEKKLKKPFLMLVEECHEYIPEGGGMDETGKMLIKVGKRGRKHGLGIVGISQRPADVKKDYITQCDWLVWHRLTWNNDTKVVGRILGSDYASAIEDMGDGEAFLMTDWAEEIRRVQFRRKQTFDAGATPGLEDFERPDLKSVSGDLVSELTDISDEKERRESELADLRQELDKKRQRITQLESELEDAQDMSNMADTFAQALLQKAEAPYRRRGRARPAGTEMAGGPGSEMESYANEAAREGHPATPSPVPDARDDVRSKLAEHGAAEGDGGRRLTDDQSELHDYEEGADEASNDAESSAGADTATNGESAESGGSKASVQAAPSPENARETEGVDTEDDATESVEATAGPDPVTPVENATEPGDDGRDDDPTAPRPVRVVAAGGRAAEAAATDAREVQNGPGADETGDETDDEPDDATGSGESREFGIVPQANVGSRGSEEAADAGTEAAEGADARDDEPADAAEAVSEVDRLTSFVEGVELRERDAVVEGFARAIGRFDDVTRGMLAHYCTSGVSSPIDAHVHAGGSGDRHWAYARNRTLRQAGLIEHVARGRYQYRLPDLVAEVFADGVDGQTLADTVAAIEHSAGLREE